MEWEKTFANDVTNKDLISKIYEHLYTSITTTKKTTQSTNEQKI